MADPVKPSAATPEQLQARLGQRSSNAAAPHRNRAREAKRPGKGNRSSQQRDNVADQDTQD